MTRVLALACWAFLAWTLLSWTATVEQIVVGGCVAVAVGLVLAPLGPVCGPWELFRPRVLAGVVRLAGYTMPRIVLANLRLARRIWSPSRPLRSGMVIVPTELDGRDGGLTVVALVTSLIVDNQFVQVLPEGLQFHAVDVPDDPAEITRRVERIVREMHR
jgi:multicomponent Na+:H+ antiporter subunit E